MKFDWRKSKTRVRLSGPGLFNLRLFAWSYLILFIPQIAFDVVAYESITWLWLPIWTLGHLLAGFAAYFIRFLWLDKALTIKPSATLNIAVAAVLGSLRVTFIGYVSFGLGLAPNFDLAARIIAGSVLGSALFAILGLVLSSQGKYQTVLRELLATQRQIENLRQAKRSEVAKLQRQWEIATRKVIEPKLEEIAREINKKSLAASTKKGIAKELRTLLDTQIKPFSARLKSTSSALTNSQIFRGVNPVTLFRIPDRVSPGLAVNPPLQLFILGGAIPFALYVFEGPEWIPLGFLVASACALFLYLNKLAVANRKAIPTIRGLAALLGLVIGQTVIGLLILLWSGFPEESIVPVTALLGSAVSLSGLMFGLAAAFEYNREAFIGTLSRNNARLERELALLNQRLWVEKREWALRIHGSAQASLTASLVRLSTTGLKSDVQLELVREHLAHARASLKSSELKPVDLKKSLAVIRKTWAGIVKIDIDLKSSPAQLILADKWAGVIANEIVKESISNSVKHGKADSVKVRFEANAPGFVEIVVMDNGRGIRTGSSQGLGSQILDEVAFPWSLTNQPGDGAKLRARIPVAKRRVASKI